MSEWSFVLDPCACARVCVCVPDHLSVYKYGYIYQSLVIVNILTDPIHTHHRVDYGCIRLYTTKNTFSP